MALHPNTQQLIDEREQVYDDKRKKSSKSGYNFSGLSSEDRLGLLRGVGQSFKPIPTQARYEDYSRFIEGAIDPIYGDIDEQRAQGQSLIEKGSYILPRIATKVATEVLKIPGELYGLGEWATKGFDFEDFSSSVDNAWVQALDKANEGINDELFPVFKRRVIEEGGLLRQIVSPEFWATEGADGIGFLLSMFTPGLATRALGIGAKIASATSKGVKGLETASKGLKLFRPETAAKVGNYVDDFVAGGINTIVESGAEAIEATRALEQTMKDAKFNEFVTLGFTPEQAEIAAENYIQSEEAKIKIGQAGANVVKANLAILLGPNILDQKWLFSKATKGAIGKKVVNNKLKTVVENLGSETAQTVTRAGAKEFAGKALTKGLIGVNKEGFFEEGFQYASSQYYQDKAMLDGDPEFSNDLVGVLDAYRDSLSDIDMQKSIFLGAVLGGGMGAIAGVRGKMMENKILFGDTKKKTPGLVSLLDKNFVERFQSVNDMLNQEKPYNEDGTPNIDPNRAKTWAATVLASEKNRKLLEKYNGSSMLTGELDSSDEQFEFAKMVNDFNYMLPFIQQEGGMELLKLHLDQMATKQAGALQQMGMPAKSVQEIKSELLDRAETFNDIYYSVVLQHRKPNVERTDTQKGLYEEFDAKLLNTKISNVLVQDLLKTRSKSYSNEIVKTAGRISELENAESRTTAEDNELKNLKKTLTELQSKKEFIDKEFVEVKEEFSQLTNKEEIQNWWKDEVKDDKDSKAELIKDVINETVTDDESARKVTDAANESSTLDDAEKKLAEAEARKKAEEEQNREASKNAITEATINTIASKMFRNMKNPNGPMETFTDEEKALIMSDSRVMERLNKLQEEEMNKQRDELLAENKLKLESFQEAINEVRLATSVTENPEETEDRRFSAIVQAPLQFDEDGRITNENEGEELFGKTSQEVIKKIDEAYDRIIAKVAERLGLEVPPAYVRQGVKDTVDIITSTDEITKWEDVSDFPSIETVALESSIAYRSKVTTLAQGKAKDELDDTGKVQLEETVNQDIVKPETYPAGTILLAEIGVNSEEEKGFLTSNIDDIDNIPIKLSAEDGTFVGYIHVVDWFSQSNKPNLTPEDRERLIEETRVMRKNFLTKGKIDLSKRFIVRITEKKAGWLNVSRGEKGQTFTVGEAFKTKDGKHDLRVKLGTLNKVNVSDSLKGVNWTTDKNGVPMINAITAMGAGMVLAAIPGANGQSIATRLSQVTLKDTDEKIRKFVIRNSIGILFNAVKDKGVTRNDILQDLMVYLFPQMGTMTETDITTMLMKNPNILFNVDLFDVGNERNIVLKVQTPNREDKYSTFKIENTAKGIKITDRYKKAEVTIEEFEKTVTDSLKNKFINVSEKALQDSNEGRNTTIKVTDDKFNTTVKEVNYRDFLSENKVLSTRVHGVETKDGYVTYVTQPTLVLDYMNFKEISQTQKEKKKEPEPKKEIKYNSVEDEIAKLEKQRDAEIAALPTFETILRELTTLYEAKTGKKREGLLHSRYIESMVNETANWFLPKDLERAKKLLVIANQYDRASEPRDYGYGPIIGKSPSQVIWDEYAEKIEELKKQKAPVEEKESLSSEEISPPPDDFRDNTIGSDEEFDFGDDEINPLRIDAHINYENTTISSFSNINNVIHENNTVASMVSSLLVMARDTDLTNKDTSDKYIDRLLELLKNRQILFKKYSEEQITRELAVELKLPLSKEVNKTFYDNITNVLDNFEETKNPDGSVKFIGYRQRINIELAKLKFIPDFEDIDRMSDEDSTEEVHVDNKNYKTDPEKSASARVKRALYNIPLKENGKVRVSMIGFPIPRNYAETFNVIMESVADLPINEIIPELESLANNADIKDEVYKQVVKTLNSFKDMGDTSSFINEFATVFRKQRAKFKTVVIYSKTPETKIIDGKEVVTPVPPDIRIIDANKIGSAGVVVDKWYQSYIVKGQLSGLLRINTEEGKMSVNRDEATKLVTKFKTNAYSVQTELLKIAKRSEETVNSDNFKPLAEVFGDIGLDISPEALKAMYFTYLRKPARLVGLTIENGKNKTDNLAEFFINNFLYIYTDIEGLSRGGDITIDEDGIKNSIFGTQGKYIAALAKYESIVNPSVLSSSFRNANGDILYGFVNPHYMSSAINTLKDTPEQFIPDVFSQSSTWLYLTSGTERVLNQEALKELDLFYFDASKNGNSKKDAVSLENMNPLEKEQTKVGLYHNNGSNKTGLFFTVAPSDKTTFSVINAVKEVLKRSTLTSQGRLSSESPLAAKLFNLFVQSEINRINSVVKEYRALQEIKGATEEETVALQKAREKELIEGYNFAYIKGKRVVGSGGYFFMIPQMNEYFKEDIERIQKGDTAYIQLSGERVQTAKQYLVDKINELIELKELDWNTLGMFSRINKDTINSFRKEFGVLSNKALVADYVINTMVAYANQYMLITGDPAKFVKISKWDGSVRDWKTLVNESSANLFKRAAKDIAPGYEGKFQLDEQTYNVLMVNEPIYRRNVEIKEAYENRLEEVLATRNKPIKLADAQVWSSLPEHLRVLAAIGRITNQRKNQLIEKFNNYMKDRTNEANKFTDAELGLILQPIKPVEVGRLWTNTPVPTAIEVYVKSSVFPLIPQLTEGLDIDDMMVFMHKHNIDKIVPNTAVKTGFFNAVDIYSDNKLALPEDGDYILSKIHKFDRKFFRIQQDVPYDPNKVKILKGSQNEKLQFANLSDEFNFNFKGRSDVKGWELKEKNDAIRTEIYRRKWNKFLKDIGGIQVGNGIEIRNFEILKNKIIEEATTRDTFDVNDIMLISKLAEDYGKRDFNTIPLYLHPAMPKIEPLLNSLIKNEVLVTKFPGKSYIQGSSMGFDFMLSGTRNVMSEIAKKSGVVFTSDYKGSLNYRISEKNGEKYLEADVFIPWYFKTESGEEIDIRQYVDPITNMLDTSKIDPQLLELIGYRIPTQGHSSMIKLRVVGFLPKSSGDLIIIPPEIVEQMGSDFDVDKLYTHRFHYESVNGKLTKIDSAPDAALSSLTDEQLQNLAMDITHSILEKTEVSEMVAKPLDNNDIQDVLDKIEALRPKKPGTIDRNKASDTSLLFDDLHSRFVDINASGKFGIGVSSIATTGHALSQYGGLYIKKIFVKDSDPIEVAIRFTDKKGNPEFNENENSVNGVKQTSVKKHDYANSVSFGLWRMDRIYSIDPTKKVSDVITNIQTESVDNASNQRLYGMHLNRHTFDVALILAKAGLTEEYIGFYLNQPIIRDYISRVQGISDIGSTEFKFGQEETIADELLGTHPRDLKVIAFDEMEDAIRNEGREYTNFDRDVLASFLIYKELGSKYGALMRGLNTDTKFLGKNLNSNSVKMDDFKRDVEEQTQFGNVRNLMDDTKPTLQYSAYKFGVVNAVSLYNNLVPYGTVLMRIIKTKIEQNSQKNRLNEDTIAELNRAIRTSIWVQATINSVLDNQSLEEKRKSLLFGKNSLAHRIVEARKKNPNTFLNYIEITLSGKDVNPNVLEFSAGGAVTKDFSLKIQQSFLELYNTDKELARDIMIYSLTNGAERNARDLSRFIPIDMYVSENIIPGLRDIYSNIFVEGSGNAVKDSFVNNFLRQFYQHNPFRAYAGDKTSIRFTNMFNEKGVNVKTIGAATTIKMQPINEMVSEFIYFYDDNKVHLFEIDKTGSTENLLTYKKIPLLGDRSTLLTEYDITQPLKRSIFAGNNVNVAKTTGTSIPVTPKEAVTITGTALLRKYNFLNNDKSLNTVLKRISESATISKGFRELAQILGTQDFSGYKTMVVDSNYVLPSNRTMKGKAGVHLPQKGLIMLNADLMAENLGLSSENFFAMSLMHELVHAMTVKKINEYSSLSEEEKRIIDGLTALWKESKTKVKSIIDSMAFDAKRESLLTVYKMYLDSHPDNEIASLKEFIAGVMTDPSLQDVLNGIRTKGGQSIWSKILSVLTDLISLINPDIKIDPDSVLANAVQNVLRLGKNIVPAEQASVAETTIAKTINIYAGTGDNAELSNFAKRPFTINIKRARTGEKSFYSVEQAFQWMKGLYTNNLEIDPSVPDDVAKSMIHEANAKDEQVQNQIENTTDGRELRRLGKKFANLDREIWDEESSNVMKELLLESFKQNPEALQKLLATGDAILTHTQDNTKWKTEFPRILMEVREELKTPVIPPIEPIKTVPESIPESVTEESPIYLETNGGNYYKFELRDGSVTKGWYRQGTKTEWKEMVLKNAVSKYEMITEMNPKGFTVFIPVEEPTPQKSDNGKTIVVPVGSKSTNLPIFEDATHVYLMNDGQQGAYDMIKGKTIEIITKGRDSRNNIREETLSEKVVFTDPLMANFNGLIPKAMFDNFLGLTGRGGVGKTTVIKKIIEDIQKELGSKYSRISVAYIAPTHTATTVLQESLGYNSEQVGNGVDTMESYLRSLPRPKSNERRNFIEDPFDPKSEFVLSSEDDYLEPIKKGYRQPVSAPDIIVIDESSMIGSNTLVKLLIRIQSDIKYRGSIKMPVFIFLGDYRQLPPVNDAMSAKAGLGPISATVLFNKDKSYELTQVMRSSDEKLHSIFDAIGSQLVATFSARKNGNPQPPMTFSKYDELTRESSENILVVKENGISGVISDYTDYLIENNNPYGMFWIHYNRLDKDVTQQLFRKIRDDYFRKLVDRGIINQAEMTLPSYRNFRKYDYIEYTRGIEYTSSDITLFEEDIEKSSIPEIVSRKLTPKGAIFKPRSRHKIVDIIPSKANLRGMAPSSLKALIPNIQVPTEKIITYNRQNKYRIIELTTGLKVIKGEYNRTTKSIDYTIKDTEGKTIANFNIRYAVLMSDPSIEEFLSSIDTSKGLYSSLAPSYIGSSHTAQGNSIKNVIIGDYNIRMNLSKGVDINDIYSSMYTSLTRTSSKLVIIKPNTATITDNQEMFTGFTTDTNQSKKRTSDQPIEQPKTEQPKKDNLRSDTDEKAFELLEINDTFANVRQTLANDFDMLEDILNELQVTRESLENLSTNKLAEIVKRICK